MRCIPQTMLWALLLALPPLALGADDEAAVREQEQQCERAREAKLKPLRDAEIARCKEQGKDAAYCERYWSDYGSATRLANGNMRPRMFDELPECVAAHEARRKLANE
jgi:hypothetical protein